MSNLRRMLMSVNGGGNSELPNEIVLSNGPNEDNAKIYEYLQSLKVDGLEVSDINDCDGYLHINASSFTVNLYEDGGCISSSTDPT